MLLSTHHIKHDTCSTFTLAYVDYGTASEAPTLYGRIEMRVLLPTPTAVAGGGVKISPPFVCVSVCFSVRCLREKTDAGRITKLDVEMFHDQSWKSTYFGVKRSKVTVTSHTNSSGVGLYTLVSADCFELLFIFRNR